MTDTPHDVVEGNLGTAGTARHVLTRMSICAFLVGIVVMLASLLSAPAQAHHRPEHTKGPTPAASGNVSASPTQAPAKSGSAIIGYGTTSVWPNTSSHCVPPLIECYPTYRQSLFIKLVSTGPRSPGAGIAGATVRINDDYTTVLDSNGEYTATWDVWPGDPVELTWTAEFLGNDEHTGSSASGVYVPY